jgi:Flp pilus assembly protein TadD
MRHTLIVVLCLGLPVTLAGCGAGESDVDRALQTVNAIDENNLSELMTTAADPEEAVSYFRRATAEKPDRIDLQRGLARSLVRSGKTTEAASAWRKLVGMPGATAADRVAYADALIRAGRWDEAERVLDAIPPTHETYSRYRLEAMIADSNKEWAKADHFYETAVGLTTTPSGVFNNWGYSKLSRGDFRAAEQLFGEALKYDPDLFTAKNNLVLARGAQRNYQMPLLDMTQEERALLLHSMALAAVKQGDVGIARALLRDAVDTHPRHFEEAVRALATLESGQG